MISFNFWAVASVLFLILMSCNSEITTTPAGRILSSNRPPTDERSIAPMADCSGDLIDFGAQVRQCFLDCEGPPEPIESASVDIHNTIKSGPLVLECSKISMQQKFTQTWTFSTIEGELETSVLPVSERECRDEIARTCPDMKCNVREPDSLKPEYHYGSVTTKTAEMILLTTATSAILADDELIKISPAGSSIPFNIRDGRGVGKNELYFWDVPAAETSCPFESVGEYGCDRYKDKEEDFYSCSGGRFSITPRKGNKDIWSSACPGLKLSEEGFFYKMKKADPKSDKSGRLSIDVLPGTAESADTSYLRHKIQQLGKKLDSDICLNQCEILSLEARTTNHTRRLVRSGLDSYLIMANGSTRYCPPNHGCRLPDNPTFCGSPPRISIICNGVARYWNPLESFTEPGGKCFKPDAIEKLTFNLGSSMYEVDNNLKIKVDNHRYHHKYENEFLRYHNSRMTMHVKTLDELKSKWDISKTESFGVGEIKTSNTTIDSPHISIGSSVLSLFSGLFSSIKSVEAVVGVLFILLVIGASVTLLERVTGLYGKLTNKQRNKVLDRSDYTTVSLDERDVKGSLTQNAGTWM